MLTGKERFYPEWLDLVTRAASLGPVLDLGTPRPFYKELEALRGRTAEPYFCVDVVHGESVDAVCDGQILAFATGSLGAVLCSHVLEHIPDPSLLLGELFRVLRPGGRAYLTFLDVWPKHASGGVGYRDFHRFKSDAIDLHLADWASVEILVGGGVIQTLLNFVARPKVQRVGQVFANALDHRWETNITPVRYVVATR